MNNTIEYKDYIGSVEFSEKEAVFFGKVMGIRCLIPYHGTNAKELVDGFHNAVDEYLATCDRTGVEPERAYKGSFNVRISPELHKRLAVCATARQISLNSFVEEALRQAVESVEP